MLRPWGLISCPLFRRRKCSELFHLDTAVLQPSNFSGKNGFEAQFHFEFCRTCQSGEKNCLEENVLASLFTNCNLRADVIGTIASMPLYLLIGVKTLILKFCYTLVPLNLIKSQQVAGVLSEYTLLLGL